MRKRRRGRNGLNPSIGLYFQKPSVKKVLKGAANLRKVNAPNFTDRLERGARNIARVEEWLMNDILNDLVSRTSRFSNFTINAAMAIIAHSHKDIDGLQMVECFWHSNATDTVTTRDPPYVPTEKIIQILLIHPGGNHWVTVSNLFAEEDNEVIVYDSAYTGYEQFDYFTIALCTNVAAESLTLTIPPSQAQTNAHDCGPFAVAFACDLAAGIDPLSRQYNPDQLREQIGEMLGSRVAKPMGTKREHVSDGQVVTHHVDLHCTCRLPDISGFEFADHVFTMVCNDCQETFHDSCIRNMPKLRSRKCYSAIKWTCKRDKCERRRRRKDVVTPVKLSMQRDVWQASKKR